MEQYRAIYGRPKPAPFHQASLNLGDLARMQGEAGDATRAYLIKETDLAQLASSLPARHILDRGKKNAAKSLSHYLAGHSGLVCIHADYRNPGQTERGVRALLASTQHYSTRAICFIGISEDLFEQLWNRALPPESAPTNPHPSMDSDNSEWSHLPALLENQPNLEIPTALRQAYLGQAPVIDWVRRLIVLTAKTDHPVLIHSETGTGKEVVARQIHQLSSRSTMTFVPVNCGGIPADLLESELFGHVRGAFTGATRHKTGMWTQADGGTLFLDEIGELSPQHQAKVLRALEDGRFRPVGAEKEISSNARIIAATNRDLSRLVEAGRFREDLYYRLFAIPIRIPALRDHRDDIPELANHFWRKVAGDLAKPLPPDVTEELKSFSWPGNARELRAFLMNVSMLADTRPVTVAMIRAVMQERLGTIPRNYQDQ